MIDKDIVNIIDEIRNESELKPENEKQLYHKNCGETVMEALKIKYELNIDDNAIKMLAPYGFGLQRGKTCGAFASGVAAIGMMFTEDKPSTNQKMKEIVGKWVDVYIKKFGSINCDYIRPNHMDPVKGCLKVQEEAGALFEDFIKDYI